MTSSLIYFVSNTNKFFKNAPAMKLLWCLLSISFTKFLLFLLNMTSGLSTFLWSRFSIENSISWSPKHLLMLRQFVCFCKKTVCTFLVISFVPLPGSISIHLKQLKQLARDRLFTHFYTNRPEIFLYVRITVQVSKKIEPENSWFQG